MAIEPLRRNGLQRAASREIELARTEGLRAATKIQAMAFATHMALTCAGSLSALEGQLLQMAPLGEARYRAIVDAYTLASCTELQRMGWQ